MRYKFNKDLVRKLTTGLNDENILAIEEELDDCFKVFSSLLVADVDFYSESSSTLLEDKDALEIFKSIFIIQIIYRGILANDEKMIATGLKEIIDKNSYFHLINLYNLRKSLQFKYKDRFVEVSKFVKNENFTTFSDH